MCDGTASDERRIVHATIVTCDDARRVLPDAELAYSPGTGLISYVGAVRGPATDRDLDAAGAIVAPGLVNAHTHSGMTLLRGYCDGSDFPAWLAAIREFETPMTAADIRAGLRLALAEMIRNGTTAFADMFRWDAELLGEVVSSGMRVLAAPAIFGYDVAAYPGASQQTGREALEATEALAAEFAGEAGVRIAFGPHAPYTCSPELLSDVASRAKRAGLGVHTHLSETAREVAQSRAEHGHTPIALAASLGLLDVPVLLAHATHATESDIALLASHRAAVAHNPVSNLKLGAGIAPVPALRAAGVRVALGTDSVASNNNLDEFEEIKLAAVLPRGVAEVSDIVSATGALDMATRDGAAALGFPESGRLEPGAAADVIVVATDVTHATPLHSPESLLAFSSHGSDVRDVIVGGRTLMRGGVLQTLDEAAVRADAAERAARIVAELAAAAPPDTAPPTA